MASTLEGGRTGTTADVDLSFRVFEVFTVTNGRIAQIEDFVDPRAALEAAGLGE